GVVACMDATTNHTSGTRIRNRFAVTSEGDRSWVGFIDTERNEPCSFEGLGQGIACVPESLSAFSYADPACSQPLAHVDADSCATVPKYASHTILDGCTGTTSIHELGTAVTPVGPLYQRDASGACVESPAAISGTYYALGAEIPATSFVTGESFAGGGASRFQSYGQLGADGSRQVDGWVDGERQDTCVLLPAEDGALRCFPFQRLRWSGYSEATCMDPVLSWTSSTCSTAPAPTVAWFASSECSARYTAVAPGAPVSTLYSYAVTETGSTCTESTPEEGTSYFAQGETIPPETFFALTTVVKEDDPGRLKPAYFNSSDGGCAFDGWYDSELGTPCSFEDMPDGTRRCLPEEFRFDVVEHYTDSACTTLASYGKINVCEGVTAPAYVRNVDYAQTCERPSVIRKVEQATLGSALPPLWFKETATTCSPITPNATALYLTLGPELEPSAFMAGELVTE
ncbi:MAG TPA: hypothetical protein VM686_32310, partial [Polyangiaceae bacterium]|nr:hypothetical protein [Polyangiaceae bacterium]